MPATASYFQHSCCFSIFAILATVFVIAIDPAFAHSVCAFLFLCHIPTLLSKAMLELSNQVVKLDGVGAYK